MKNLTKDQRLQRIWARGEHSNHCHVITGEAEFNENGELLVRENSEVIVKHLLESEWMEGKEVWTKEHTDIKLTPGVYKPIQQKVFDPLSKRIEDTRD